MVTAKKSTELVLSEPVKEFYKECWEIANKTLQKLGINTEFLQKIKDPYEFSKLSRQNGNNAMKGINDAGYELNRIFASRNRMSEWLSNDLKTNLFLSDYIKENFGTNINFVINPVNFSLIAATDRINTIYFFDLHSLLDSITAAWHEVGHMEEPFAKKLAEIEANLLSQRVGGLREACSKFTGLSADELDKELQNQMATHGKTDALVFLIELYEKGKFKPTDERMVENLESSRFIANKEMRRAYLRYSEGMAYSRKAELLNSGDEVLRAAAALDFLWLVVFPTPSFYLEERPWSRDFASDAREHEGFRFYYTLQTTVGKERLKRFEKVCAEKNLIPGIDEAGNLVVIDPKEMKMYKVDLDKLKAGIYNIEELIGKAPRLPEKMG